MCLIYKIVYSGIIFYITEHIVSIGPNEKNKNSRELICV